MPRKPGSIGRIVNERMIIFHKKFSFKLVSCNALLASLLQETTHTRNGPSATNPRLARLASSLSGPYPTTG